MLAIGSYKSEKRAARLHILSCFMQQPLIYGLRTFDILFSKDHSYNVNYARSSSFMSYSFGASTEASAPVVLSLTRNDHIFLKSGGPYIRL